MDIEKLEVLKKELQGALTELEFNSDGKSQEGVKASENNVIESGNALREGIEEYIKNKLDSLIG